MGSRSGCRRRQQRWCAQSSLTPLMEGPDLEAQEEGLMSKKESSWDVIREWFRAQKNFPAAAAGGGSNANSTASALSLWSNLVSPKRQDLRLLLGVLGCPLAPIPLGIIHPPHIIKHVPIETSMAHYIIQQYLAATGCLKKQLHHQREDHHQEAEKLQKQKQGGTVRNMYAAGVVKMTRCETEISSAGTAGGKGGGGVRSLGGTKSGENGCFVLWQMGPGMWSLELVLGAAGHKVLAGSDGKIVWRHTPWLGTHAAKGPHRPLRRIIQGLDPKSTASLFEKAQCLGERRIGEDDCFVLKVAADREAVMERNEGPAEVIRHVLYGYFSQKSGLLIYMEDSHLTRVRSNSRSKSNIDDDDCVDEDEEDEEEELRAVYWETTIGSSIGDYREVDGVLIAHQGRTVGTVFRFGELSAAAAASVHEYSRTRMEEIWRIDDVVFNVPGLSVDSFIPPADIFRTAL